MRRRARTSAQSRTRWCAVSRKRTVLKILGALFAVVMLFIPGTASLAANAGEAAIQLRELRRLGNDFSVTAIAWHPDGRHIGIGQVLDRRIAIWDTHTGRRVRTIESEPGGVSSLAYSPDGRYLAVGREFGRLTRDGAHVHLYDAKSGSLLSSFIPPEGPAKGDFNDAKAIGFSLDSHYLVASGYGSSRTAVVYDLKTGNAIHVLPDSDEPGFRVINVIVFSPDSHFLALGRVGGRIDVWSVSDWTLVKRIEGQTGGIHALAFNPDGRYLASGTNVGKRYDRSSKPQRPMFDKFTDDIVLWSMPGFERAKEFPSRYFRGTPNSSIIHHLQFFPDGKHLLVGARSRALEIIDTASNTVAFYREGFSAVVYPSLSPDGRRLAIALGGGIGIYEVIVH